jgi:hypothetical protein
VVPRLRYVQFFSLDSHLKPWGHARSQPRALPLRARRREKLQQGQLPQFRCDTERCTVRVTLLPRQVQLIRHRPNLDVEKERVDVRRRRGWGLLEPCHSVHVHVKCAVLVLIAQIPGRFPTCRWIVCRLDADRQGAIVVVTCLTSIN